MHVEATTALPLESDADAVAVGVFEDEPLELDGPGNEFALLLSSGETRRAFRQLGLAHIGERRLILVGLGERSKFDPERARVAAALAGRRARETGTRALCWRLPPGTGAEIAEGLVHGTVLGAYRFDRYRPSEDEPAGLERLIVSAAVDVADAVARAALLAEAQNRARELGNRPPNDLTPTALGDYAAALARRVDGLVVEQFGEGAIRELGMGAFAAVSQGSEQEARMIVLRYRGAGDGAPTLALVGKAVTFDSGGLWIKPPASMPDMKFDMCGGAAVIEAIGALAELAAPVNVLGVVGATENVIGSAAMRPGDIVTALDGTTVQIDNTDAEGRLVLADCITWARRDGADAIVDIATLTGGIVVALGSVYAGVMSNDDRLAALAVESGDRTGELLWRQPLHPDYADMVKGRYGQIVNMTERREASAITAAEFLHHFAGDTPWAHLDIAGVSDGIKREYFDKGGTGFGVRLLTEIALAYGR